MKSQSGKKVNVRILYKTEKNSENVHSEVTSQGSAIRDLETPGFSRGVSSAVKGEHTHKQSLTSHTASVSKGLCMSGSWQGPEGKPKTNSVQQTLSLSICVPGWGSRDRGKPQIWGGKENGYKMTLKLSK